MSPTARTAITLKGEDADKFFKAYSDTLCANLTRLESSMKPGDDKVLADIKDVEVSYA